LWEYWVQMWLFEKVQEAEEEKNKLKQIVREQLQQVLHEMDLASKEDIKRLEERIQNLENRSE